MRKHSKTLKILEEQGICATLKYQFFKRCAKFLAPFLYKRNHALPPNYRFYFITYHATGHNAMTNFLKYCNISLNVQFLESGFERYKSNYVRLSTKPTYAALALCEYNFKDFTKYTSTLDSKVPALILVRDPISILKSGINFAQPQQDKQLMGGGAE
ncbi:hypothetical protein OQH61_01960 [Helicobacter sp. MIT 21-1697]|uniref:hypothetical protein n=1 Tax=Helicobacter sp. MIT 21-1697 TaxID=2993733 RepID=UPI00224A5BAF|nr:hypothetical protein [Helicobacter sp. MIT 21-1697]MCX2716496.1 hypothetical protein [Helicobacter sp. MIT 21-1697]